MTDTDSVPIHAYLQIPISISAYWCNTNDQDADSLDWQVQASTVLSQDRHVFATSEIHQPKKNAWMTPKQFSEWFQEDFVPHIRSRLAALGEEPVLVLDNCSAHPDQELVSDDGAILAKFLPPNVTSLIQPMDQGVIQCVKCAHTSLC